MYIVMFRELDMSRMVLGRWAEKRGSLTGVPYRMVPLPTPRSMVSASSLMNSGGGWTKCSVSEGR